MKDSVTYYFRDIASVGVMDDIQREYARCMRIHKRHTPYCLILVLRKSAVSAEEVAAVKQFALERIEAEGKPFSVATQVCLPVLADEDKGELIFFDMQSRLSFTSYAHGCRMLGELILSN